LSNIGFKAILTLAAALAAYPAAAIKLIPAGVPVQVAKSPLTVVPNEDWNRFMVRPGRNGESWTLDGLTLDDLTYYGGIAEGMTLFREADKKDAPLPRFSAKMLIPDVAQMFEASYRISNKTPIFSIDSIEPATFAGLSGFHFSYSFVVQGEDVRRKGDASGAIKDGKLYMISYEAPVIHYFDAHIGAYQAIVKSARFGR
jgi:hypothetical protein